MHRCTKKDSQNCYDLANSFLRYAQVYQKGQPELLRSRKQFFEVRTGIPKRTARTAMVLQMIGWAHTTDPSTFNLSNKKTRHIISENAQSEVLTAVFLQIQVF
jgi:hypothetical protein